MPLPVPADTMRVKLRAALVAGGVDVEEAVFGFWGINIHSAGAGLDWQEAVERVATGVRAAWDDNITTKAWWSTAVEMRSVTVDHLQASDGTILNQGSVSFGVPTTWYGSGATSLPWETSVAVSLFGYERGTFAQNKGRKRGRFYLPPMATGVMGGPTGELDISTVTGLRTQIGAFLNDVQGINTNDPTAQDNDYFDLRVISRGTPLKPLPPTSTPVTDFYIDSKVDSQRRRERQQSPQRTEHGTVDHA